MVATKIKNIKDFMNHFLNTEAFDSFYLEEASITTFNTFRIDGRINSAYYQGSDASLQDGEKPTSEFSSYKQIRPICFSLIKGRRLPVSFQFVLHAGDRYMERVKNNNAFTEAASHLTALTLVVRFENQTLTCMTGTAYDTFVLSKTIDNAWDTDFISSLTALGIAFELI